MKLVRKNNKSSGNGAADDVLFAGDGDTAGENSTGRMVVVGVRLDQQSRELLTWALVKVAQPGDLVVALHVLHSSTEEQSTLLSLVKTFDSVLAVYEGFCNLKQVDLKLKVCRGSSLRKILVREAKVYESATLILGACKAQHAIRSPTSVAKYCAKKLSSNYSVFAVDNGKIVFQREGNLSVAGNGKRSCHLTSEADSNSANVLNDEGLSIKIAESNQEILDGFEKQSSGHRRSTLIKRYLGCAPVSSWADYPCDKMVEESNKDGREEGSLALVPYEGPETSAGSVSAMDLESHDMKSGWPLIRRILLHKHSDPSKIASRKPSIVRRVWKLPARHSSMAVHPDSKRGTSVVLDDQFSDRSGESGAIIPVGDCVSSVPCSPAWSKGLPQELEGFHEKYSSTCRLFTYQELLSATSNFIPGLYLLSSCQTTLYNFYTSVSACPLVEKLIGKGGSSQVYEGCLPDGKKLAVKILKLSEDVLQEFIAEVEIITAISHKNIISLFGFCFENENLILVYDFQPRGSLEEKLHGNKKDAKAFGWNERYKVAVGVAEALDYLHNRDPQTVIHRDVKSSNILLSDEFEPQLADFGLATWASSASSNLVFSDVAGTFGYLAPEYFMHGKVTDKMDVYAFGVVLLELLSGRKPIDNTNPKGKESLVIWANSVLKDGKISQLLDPDLSNNYKFEQIERMVLAVTLCIRRDPQTRPRMGSILKLLQGDLEVSNWAKEQVNSYPVDVDELDGETSPVDIQSHLNVALLDIVEDDSVSICSSSEQNISLEDYLKGRWSRSSSFD